MNRKLLIAISLLMMLICAYSAGAQDTEDKMDTGKTIKIRWFGQSAFGVTTSAGTKIIIDPANFKGYKMPDDIIADIIVISHEHMDHNVINFDSTDAVIFHGTDEKCSRVNIFDTTINDVKLYSVSSFHSPGGERFNAIFVFEFDGIRTVHLGDIGTTLTKEQVEAIGPVDILMVPVGGYYTIAAPEADSIVNQLNVKRLILPMHYKTEAFDGLPGTVDMFLAGKENFKRLDTNEMLIDLSAPIAKREYVVLKY